VLVGGILSTGRMGWYRLYDADSGSMEADRSLFGLEGWD
jgi:hypothetical protein